MKVVENKDVAVLSSPCPTSSKNNFRGLFSSDRREVSLNVLRLYYKRHAIVPPPSRAMWHYPHTNDDICLRTRRRDKDQNAIMRSLTRRGGAFYDLYRGLKHHGYFHPVADATH